MTQPDISRSRHIHIVGIGGAGMSAIATVLSAMGHTVSGSDLKDNITLERLRAIGVQVMIGHAEENVARAEMLAISSAIGATNVEVLAARDRDVLVHSRAEMLVEIAKARRTIAVSGTHGKTTTTSMLALILVEAGLDPSFIIGGEVNEIGTNAVWGTGQWLAVEADESDGTFLDLLTEIAIVTSVEPDHIEHYGSVEALQDAFARFAGSAGERAVICIDDPGAFAIAPAGARTYGFSPDADLQIRDFVGKRASSSFTLFLSGEALGEVRLALPGRYNALNATAAVAAALLAGASFDAARRALARFAGVARRFEFRGEKNGVVFVDDYAHLPGETSAILRAARDGDFERIVCVFQPHRYSRIAALAPDFANAFLGADVLVITGIYPAGEAPRPGVSAKLVLDAVLDAHSETKAAYLPQRSELVRYLTTILRAGDCCLTLSAGDLTSLSDELLADPTW